MGWELNAISKDQWVVFGVESRFRVRELAKLSRTSERGLEIHFRNEFKSSPKIWLRKLRVCFAAQRIRCGHCLKAVAADLYYSSSSHLIADFKSFFGYTPLKYRCSQAKLSVLADRDWPTEWTQLDSNRRQTHLLPEFARIVFPRISLSKDGKR